MDLVGKYSIVYIAIQLNTRLIDEKMPHAPPGQTDLMCEPFEQSELLILKITVLSSVSLTLKPYCTLPIDEGIRSIGVRAEKPCQGGEHEIEWPYRPWYTQCSMCGIYVWTQISIT